MGSNADPNAARRPGEPFRYKPAKLLEASEKLRDQMVQLGMLDTTHIEAAATLGVSRSTLEAFWAANPDFEEAYLAGKQLDKVRTRKLVRMHAVSDPGTARFLAKNLVGMSDDPSKAKLDETTAKALKAVSKQEALGRILELQRKLVGGPVIEHDPHETDKNERNQSGEGVHAGARRGVSHGADATRPGGAAPDQAQGQRVLPAAGQEGGTQPSQGQGSTVERLQQRLAALEASVVRKNPRKDGASHTDRSQPVDAPANKSQKEAPHVPGRLPGRIGRL